MEEHEFTEEQNKVFNGLIRNIIFLSILVIAGSIGSLAQVSGSAYPSLMIAETIAYAIMGITLYLPVNNFRKIVLTEGRDITELMIGFDKIRKTWILLNIATAMVLVLRISVLVDIVKSLP
jgi:hypothetical protein